MGTDDDTRSLNRNYMDRNIITEADVLTPELGCAEQMQRSRLIIASTSFFNFIPSESIGLYVGLDGIVRSAASDTSSVRFWLSLVLITCVIFTWLYLRRIWHIRRLSQVAVSTAALIAYVFAIGGVFREFDFYRPWQSTLVLVITTAFLVSHSPRAETHHPSNVKATELRGGCTHYNKEKWHATQS